MVLLTKSLLADRKTISNKYFRNATIQVTSEIPGPAELKETQAMQKRPFRMRFHANINKGKNEY